MDPQALFNFVSGIVLSALAWGAKELWSAFKEMRKDIHQIEIDLPTHYLRRDEFQEGIRQIREDLQIVFKKLDNLSSTKQDK